jgi:hypothetical protein
MASSSVKLVHLTVAVCGVAIRSFQPWRTGCPWSSFTPFTSEVAGDVVEPLNVVLLARTSVCIFETVLKVEGRNGLAIK